MPSKRRRQQAPKAPEPAAAPAADPEASSVTAFRLKGREISTIKGLLPNIVTGNSHHLLCRKLARDFADMKLVYLNRRDRLNSREGS